MSLPSNPIAIARLSELGDRVPAGALVGNVDLVIVRADDAVTVLYGRCLHRGALMADGHVSGQDLICGVHGWDYRIATGISAYNNPERLPVFDSWTDGDAVFVTFASLNGVGRSSRAKLPAYSEVCEFRLYNRCDLAPNKYT